MSSGPFDWTPLGLDRDPAPGDTDVLARVQQDFRRMSDEATEVNSGLDALLRAAENGGFKGATSEALREEISGRLKRFIGNVAASFDVAASAVARYRDALAAVQKVTAWCLEAARRAGPNDLVQLGLLRDQVQQQRDRLVCEARGLEQSLDDAAEMVSQPIKAKSRLLAIFEIALLVGAAVLGVAGFFAGGWVALAAYVVNEALFIKNAVEFSRGEAGAWWQLALAAAGILFPSTRGVGFGWAKGALELVRSGGSLLGGAVRGALTAGRAALSPMRTAALARAGVTVLPELIVGSGSAAFRAIGSIPGVVGRTVSSLPGVISSAGGFVRSTWNAGVTAVRSDFVQVTMQAAGMASKVGTYVLVNTGRAFDLAVAVVTPLHYSEIAALNYGGAFRMAFVERGLSMTAVGGADLISAGAGVGHAGVDLSEPGAVIRVVEAVAPSRLDTPAIAPGAVQGLGSVPDLGHVFGPGRVQRLPGATGQGGHAGLSPASRPSRARLGEAGTAQVPGSEPPDDPAFRLASSGRSARLETADAEVTGASVDLVDYGARDSSAPAPASSLDTASGRLTDVESASKRLAQLEQSLSLQSTDSGLLVLADHAAATRTDSGLLVLTYPAATRAADTPPLPGFGESHLRSLRRGDFQAVTDAGNGLTVRIGDAAGRPMTAGQPPAARLGGGAAGEVRVGAADDAVAGTDPSLSPVARIGARNAALDLLAGGHAGNADAAGSGTGDLAAAASAAGPEHTVGPHTPTAARPRPAAEPTPAAEPRPASAVESLPGCPQVPSAPVETPSAPVETPSVPDSDDFVPAASARSASPRELRARAKRWNDFRDARDAWYTDRFAMSEQLKWHTGRLDSDLDAALARFRRDDLFGGAYLSDGSPALKQVREGFHNDAKAIFETGWKEADGRVMPQEAWKRRLDELRSGLGERLARASERERRTAAVDSYFDQALDRFRQDDLFGGVHLSDAETVAAARAAERTLTGDTLDAIWAQTAGHPTEWRTARLEAALNEARSGLPGRLAEASRLQRFLRHGQRTFDAALERWQENLTSGGALSEKAAARVREEFTEGLRTTWQRLTVPEHGTALETMVAALPERFEYAQFHELQLERAQRALDDAYGRYENDLAGGRPLTDDAKERLTNEWTQAVESACGEHWFSVPGRADFRVRPARTGQFVDGDPAGTGPTIDEVDRPLAPERAGAGMTALHERGFGTSSRRDSGVPGAAAVPGTTVDGPSPTPARTGTDAGSAAVGDAPSVRPSWDERFEMLTGTLRRRLEHESALHIVLEKAADDFVRIAGRPEDLVHQYDVSSQSFDELADGFRKDTVTEYDRLWVSESRDTDAWLRHEAERENAFGAGVKDAQDKSFPGVGDDKAPPAATAPELLSRPAADGLRPQTGLEGTCSDAARVAVPQRQPSPPVKNETATPRTPRTVEARAVGGDQPGGRIQALVERPNAVSAETSHLVSRESSYPLKPGSAPEPPVARPAAEQAPVTPAAAECDAVVAGSLPVTASSAAAAGDRTVRQTHPLPPEPHGAQRSREIVLAVKPGPKSRSEAEIPWYVNHDALGEVTVMCAEDGCGSMAKSWAGRIARAATRPGDSEALLAAIGEGVRKLLSGEPAYPESAALNAGQGERLVHPADTSEAVVFWERALQQGHFVLAHGQLVWLRPVLRGLEPAPAEPSQPGVRNQILTWSNVTSRSGSELETSAGIDSMLLTVLSSCTAAASTMQPAAMVLGVTASRSRGTESERYVQATRKGLVGTHELFHGGVHVRVFVDGVERPHQVVTPRWVTVGFPSWYSTPGGPRPDMADLPNARDVIAQRSHHAREVINAIDLIPMTAKLQRHLLEAGLPTRAVHEVMCRVLPQLNERGAINRSRYLLTNGLVSDGIRIPVGPVGSFQGHLVMYATIERLQYFGNTPKVTVREDSGGMWRSGHRRGTESTAFAGARAVVGGSVKGVSVLPSAALTGQFQRESGHRLIEDTATHTIMNAVSDQARYRAHLRVTAEVRSTTHEIPALHHLVESEISVPAAESACFERRMFGDDDVPPPRQAAPRLDGPVEAQPHVRALLREAGLALPESAYQRPARLDQPLPDPHPREPLALATRRGQGFGMAIALPGAELVHDQIRGVLARWHTRLSAGAKADWSATDRDLLAWFSRPALESDLGQLFSGLDHTVRLGGRSYDVSVRAYLLERVGGRTGDDGYPMAINVRTMQGITAGGHRGLARGVRASVGGYLQMKLPWLRFQLGMAQAEFGVERGVENEFSGKTQSSQRTDTAGLVDEHVYNTVYEVAIRSGRHPVERWWIDRPGDVVVRLAVPHQHVPPIPLSAEQVRQAGRVTRLTALPDGPLVDFRSHGVGAVYKSFLPVPEASWTAAQLYQEANGLPKDWLADRANWPAEIKGMFHTTRMAAHFGALASSTGQVVQLPTSEDGWKQAFQVRVTGHRPRHVAAHIGPGRELQLWQNTSAGAQYRKTTSSGHGIGVGAAVGLQLSFGRSPDDDGPTDRDGTAAVGDQQATGQNGLLFVTARGELVQYQVRERSVSVMPVGVSRGTYIGRTHTYRADPVFELTLHRWKGRGSGGTAGTTVYLRVKDGMDFVVPERRIPDLGLPVPEGVAQVRPHEPEGYFDPALMPLGTHPEVLYADGVLDRMKQWLTEQGLLRAMGDSGGHWPSPLLQQLERSFSSDALLSQFSLLTSSGVMRWIPLPWAFGGTRYLWAHVSAETGPPVSQLNRPELQMMLRGNDITEWGETSRTGLDASVAVRLCGWAGDAGHGGLRLGGGYYCGTETGVERSHKQVKTYWGQTRSSSQEFEHPQTYRVRMGITAELPEVLSAPGRGVQAAVLSLADRLGHGRDAARWWHRNKPFVKRFPAQDQPDAGTVHGSVRLIVPNHLVIHDTPLPTPAPAHGTSAAWESGTTGQHPVESPDHQKLVDQLVNAGHPWSLPAAAAVHRWAALTAAPFRPPRDLTEPDVWRVPGVDFTTVNGLRYSHFTSENLLRLNIGPLLRHRYEIPFGGHLVTVGLEVTGITPLTAGKGVTLLTRHFKQCRVSSQNVSQHSRGWFAEAGPEAGEKLGGGALIAELLTTGYGVERSHEQAGESENIIERNKTTTVPFLYYKADVDLVMTGPRGRLRVRVPDGLYFMLPTDTDTDALDALRLRAGGTGRVAPSTG